MERFTTERFTTLKVRALHLAIVCGVGLAGAGCTEASVHDPGTDSAAMPQIQLAEIRDAQTGEALGTVAHIDSPNGRYYVVLPGNTNSAHTQTQHAAARGSAMKIVNLARPDAAPTPVSEVQVRVAPNAEHPFRGRWFAVNDYLRKLVSTEKLWKPGAARAIIPQGGATDDVIALWQATVHTMPHRAHGTLPFVQVTLAHRGFHDAPMTRFDAITFTSYPYKPGNEQFMTDFLTKILAVDDRTETLLPFPIFTLDALKHEGAARRAWYTTALGNLFTKSGVQRVTTAAWDITNVREFVARSGLTAPRDVRREELMFAWEPSGRGAEPTLNIWRVTGFPQLAITAYSADNPAPPLDVLATEALERLAQ